MTRLKHPMLLIAALLLSMVSNDLAIAQPKPVIAEVLTVDGKVELKRGKDDYRLVKEGETLQNGDLLKARKGSKTMIRCTANSSSWSVPDDGLPWGVANVCSSSSRSNRSAAYSRISLRLTSGTLVATSTIAASV